MYVSASRAVRGIRPEDVLGWSLPQGPLRGEALSALARRLAQTEVDLDPLASWIDFGSEGYQRITLFASSDWEMVLTCWLPGQHSAVHDHGGSCGASLVLAGRLTESLFCQGAAAPLRPECVRVVGPGEVLIETCQTVHCVENRSSGTALALHFYSPPIVHPEPLASRPA